MIPMLDCSPKRQPEIAEKLNCLKWGQLCTPLTNNALNPDVLFGIDNGGYSKQEPRLFENLLNKLLPHKHRCVFAAVPDIPGDGRRTLELFHMMRPCMTHWPLALIMQDGVEHLDIPWDKCDAIFMAGSGDWKMSVAATNIIKTAKWLKKWVHVGRISDPERWDFFAQLGCDSADSSVLVKQLPGRTDALAEYFRGQDQSGLVSIF